MFKRKSMTMALENFKISDSAAQEISSLRKKDPGKKFMRVSITNGGCSGFQYNFDLVENIDPEDLVFENKEARVVIDPVSFTFLQNAELDHVKELMGSYFTLKNPNSQSKCGCGSSFSV